MYIDKSTRQFLLVVVLPMVLVLVAGITLLFSGYPAIGQAIASYGTLLVMLFALCYIALKDSKKRWPHLSAPERFIRVMTMKR